MGGEKNRRTASRATSAGRHHHPKSDFDARQREIARLAAHQDHLIEELERLSELNDPIARAGDLLEDCPATLRRKLQLSADASQRPSTQFQVCGHPGPGGLPLPCGWLRILRRSYEVIRYISRGWPGL